MQRKAAVIGRTVTMALALSVSACSASHATKTQASGEAFANACDLVRNWQASGSDVQRRLLPVAGVSDGDITYRFAPAGTPVASLTAACGNGPYAECEVAVSLRDGSSYSFTELSRFELLDMGNDVWMVYRLQSPTSVGEKTKRRIVKVAREPVTLCDEIGDYSDVM